MYTTESELTEMSAAICELMWLQKICIGFAIDAKKPTLWGDKKSSNFIALIPVSSERSKHMVCGTLR